MITDDTWNNCAGNGFGMNTWIAEQRFLEQMGELLAFMKVSEFEN